MKQLYDITRKIRKNGQPYIVKIKEIYYYKSGGMDILLYFNSLLIRIHFITSSVV